MHFDRLLYVFGGLRIRFSLPHSKYIVVMKVPKYRPLATALIVFILFLGISRPVEAAGLGGVHPLTWVSSVVQSLEGFFGHFFSPKRESASAPPPTPTPGQEARQPIIEQAPAPVTNITQVISPFGNGLTLVSQYGDLYPKDGLAPALGTALHPYSQLNMTNASIDSNGSLMLSGALTVTGFGSGIVHTDRRGHFSTAAIDLGTGDLTGVLPVGSGGTGATSLTANGVLLGNGSNGLTALTPGTTGSLLQSNGTGAPPSWVATSGLSAGNAASLLGGTWAAPGAIGSGTANTGAFTTLTASGGVAVSSLTTNGGVLYTNGSGTVTQTAAGTPGTVLHGGTLPVYGLLALGSEVSGTLPLLSGGTGATTPSSALANLGGEPAFASGTTAQYLRGDKTFQTLTTAVVPEGTNLYYTQGRFDTAFSAKTTTNLAEGSNLYRDC